MLKEIVFVIADEGQARAAEVMRRNFAEEERRWKENIKIVPYYEEAEGCGEVSRTDCLKEEALFITDTEKALEELKRDGKYVIALLHEENKEQNLSGVSYAVTDIAELTPDSLLMVYKRLKGEPWEILETTRCLIREMTVEDVDEFYKIYAEPSITCYMDPLFEETKQEREYVSEYIEKIYGFYGYGLWSVVEKKEHKVIGRAGISWREGCDIPELGFVIAVPYQRQGYAYEVCTAILEYGKEELQFDKIQALVKNGNTASVLLCEKLGMKWYDTVSDGESVYERYVTSFL